jgi:hypothetical protein
MRRLALAVAVVCATALAAGTGSFSAATIERGVSVDVVEPSDGFVGIEDAPATVEVAFGAGPNPGAESAGASAVGGGETVRLLTLRNNLDTTVEYRVAVAEDGHSPPTADRVWLADGSSDDSAVVDPGDAVDVLADIDCANQPAETWTVAVTAVADGFEGHVDHEVEVRCEGPPPEPARKG